MSPITNSKKFFHTIINGIDYTLAYVQDRMGNEVAYFVVEEPGKEADQTTFTPTELKALKFLIGK